MLLGYDSVFKRKTEFKDLHEEGVVVCYKRDFFQLFKSVEIDFNDVADEDEMPAALRDRVINDDVALMLYLQPWPVNYLKSAVCCCSAMLSDKDNDFDVRALQTMHLVRSIELSNRDYLLPIIMGITLFDEPSSQSYHILRTGNC